MKRKNERVPGFDEVIFRDRNKEYGAYDLRKSYNRTLGISLLGGLALATILVLLPSFTTKTKTIEGHTTEITVIQPDQDLLKAIEQPAEKKIPTEVLDVKRLLAPVVVDSGVDITNTLPPNDDALDLTKDGTATEIPAGDSGDGEILPVEKPKPFFTVQEMPEFPGGEPALLRFIADNLAYPADAIENHLQGKVIVRFVVSSTGSVDDISVIASQGTGLDLSVLEKEAIRVIRILPMFRPGKQNGVPVPVYYTVPVIFKMN
jgi:periplasmic protein TonB